MKLSTSEIKTIVQETIFNSVGFKPKKSEIKDVVSEDGNVTVTIGEVKYSFGYTVQTLITDFHKVVTEPDEKAEDADLSEYSTETE